MKKDLFSDENLAQSNWAKFEKVGDKVEGRLVGQRSAPAKGNFSAQIVYELETEDGQMINVGIAEHKTFIHDRMKSAKIGQEVGFLFKEEVESETTGFAPAKSILVYLGDVVEAPVEDSEEEVPFN